MHKFSQSTNFKLKRTLKTNFIFSTVLSVHFIFVTAFLLIIPGMDWWAIVDYFINCVCMFVMLASNRRLCRYCCCCKDQRKISVSMHLDAIHSQSTQPSAPRNTQTSATTTTTTAIANSSIVTPGSPSISSTRTSTKMGRGRELEIYDLAVDLQKPQGIDYKFKVFWTWIRWMFCCPKCYICIDCQCCNFCDKCCNIDEKKQNKKRDLSLLFEAANIIESKRKIEIERRKFHKKHRQKSTSGRGRGGFNSKRMTLKKKMENEVGLESESGGTRQTGVKSPSMTSATTRTEGKTSNQENYHSHLPRCEPELGNNNASNPI